MTGQKKEHFLPRKNLKEKKGRKDYSRQVTLFIGKIFK